VSRRRPRRRCTGLLLSRRGRSAIIACLLGCIAGFVGLSPAITAEAAEAPATFDYLYIVANEGGSSGGHTAIRFGRDIYHFQNENGLLVLNRERAADFLYTYSLLGNRTIHVTKVGVSRETRDRLADRFRRRHRAQEAQLRIDTALRRDRALLERIHEHTERPNADRPAPTLSIPGLGYFRGPGSADAGRAHSETLVRLRDEVVRVHGPDFLSNRRADLMRASRDLARRDPTAWAIESPVSAYDHPAFARAYSDRWLDVLGGLAALDVLDEARPLDPAGVHAPVDPAFMLDEEEIQAFGRFAETISDQLVRLVGSNRSDWGQAMLIGMARLGALTRSIESRRLVLLDSFPDGADLVGEAQIERRVELGSTTLADNLGQLQRSRRYFRDSGDAREIAWERVEERGNRALEIRRAIVEGGSMRVARGHLVPTREAPYPLPAFASNETAHDSQDIDRAQKRQKAHWRALRRLHRYRLLDQNCATAIFETINETFDDSVALSEAQLGGHVASRNSLSFIPFISDRQVSDRYSVVSRETIPSYRERRLHSMKAEESPLLVALRESNTFTSTTYDRGEADSFFVFFTDDAPLLRPILGAVNLTAALGQSVIGIVTAPVDRGSNFVRGVRGTFVSLVELGFANIRKGSNDWIPTEHRTLEPIPDELARAD